MLTISKQPVTRGVLELGMLRQPEMIVFDQHPKKAMAFPCAHLIAAEVLSSRLFELDFHTHVIRITAEDAHAIYDEVLAGEVYVLTTVRHSDRTTPIRSVLNIDVRSGRAETPYPSGERALALQVGGVV